MGYARVVIQIISERYFPPQANMIMSQSLIKRLHLPQHPVWVTFGSATDTAFIVPIQNRTPLIRLSTRLASRLKISGQKTLNAHYDPPSRRIHFGPLLGILMNRDVEGNETQPFGAMSRFLEECVQCCSTKGVYLTVFSPEQIDLSSKSLRGWIYENKKWVLSDAPLPDVIYNRITSRRLENRTELQRKLDTLRHTYRIPVFNETFLNKQQVHDMLVKDEGMRRMLPETHAYQAARLKPMLERYRTIYLKPTNGSLGQGIIRITRQEGHLICQYSEAAGTVTRIFSSLKDTLRRLSRRLAGSRYIIQQGLDLVTVDGRPVDFRVLVQKDGKGKWSVTSAVGRIANSQHIVSNLARGGTIRKAGEVLAEIRTFTYKPSLDKLRQTALAIAHTFERLAQGHFAELGIDLVLDRRGRLWLIELNSKPSKTDDTITTPTLTARPSVTRLIDYTLHISGWSPHIRFHRRKMTPKSNRSGRKTR
ncbi:YheC/YheD family endospore coat-associated protein [Paludifilum halophilum]|uniref:ATP-grasp domain-containing protein n=1 Tax=Paludifilum halophilum TaxID=1642702 RepID=A0A235BA28_9BACL|nr:YheC/YheD family protein [Paludifilum halophilum]OYD08435.1 hypothetical protein CHM34_06270 [Paludifilum halophilum]